MSSKRPCKTLFTSLPTPQQPNIDPDLANRLRDVGSHVRKHVTEGYNTPPSSFSKAQSTGSIFRSMKDTLRDVYSNLPVEPPNKTTIQKRSRSLSPDEDMSLDDNDMRDKSLVEAIKLSRPIKPLRRPRHCLLETRSLPNGPLLFDNPDHTLNHVTTEPIDEEDDWSNQKPNNDDFDQPFEPMVL